MKKLIEYCKIIFLVSLSIVALYYLQIVLHSNLHQIIAFKLKSISSQWTFYEVIFYRLFDFCIALTGFLLFWYYKKSKKYSEDLLFILSIPALFPFFTIGMNIISGFFVKPCYLVQYDGLENLINVITHICYWLYSIFFAIFVLVKLTRKYALIFLIEYLLFLCYICLFFEKLIGPIKLPFHLY